MPTRPAITKLDIPGRVMVAVAITTAAVPTITVGLATTTVLTKIGQSSKSTYRLREASAPYRGALAFLVRMDLDQMTGHQW